MFLFKRYFLKQNGRNCFFHFLFFILLIKVSICAESQSPEFSSYFVSIKPQSREVLVNVRSGPGQHYPLEWQIIRARWPLEVLRKFEHWRHVRDSDGSTGWIHQNMLSGKRTVVFLKAASLYKKPDTTTTVVAQIDRDVIAQPLTCEEAWCYVRIEDFKGWAERTVLWGVYPHETKF